MVPGHGLQKAVVPDHLPQRAHLHHGFGKGRDRMDPPDSYLAEGKAERFAPGDPASAKPYELYFADWAETVAIGRALTNAGFDVPFVNVLQDGLLLDPFTGEVLDENGGLSAFLARLPLKLKRLLGLGPGPGPDAGGAWDSLPGAFAPPLPLDCTERIIMLRTE